MAEELEQREVVNHQELLMSQMIQLDTVTQLLIEKGVFGEQGFFTELKEVQVEYQRRSAVRNKE